MYPKKFYFQHPVCDNLKAFVFADAPHLLKLLRNHLLDQGFIWNSKIIDKEILLKLLSINAEDLKTSYKITAYHVQIQGLSRDRKFFLLRKCYPTQQHLR